MLGAWHAPTSLFGKSVFRARLVGSDFLDKCSFLSRLYSGRRFALVKVPGLGRMPEPTRMIRSFLAASSIQLSIKNLFRRPSTAQISFSRRQNIESAPRGAQ